MSDNNVYLDGIADGEASQAKRIAELEEAIRELAETVVTFWTSADFVTRSDSLTKARKNTIACRAIDEARGIK
jgi:hypothetical protein